ncbi:MAG: hypothetical protein L0215_13030 [Gemmataceae bacterium]|nr:hypothetical protein [Gemmataceae bacterium]
MSVFVKWAKAYARQAGADLRTWDQLDELTEVPECHKRMRDLTVHIGSVTCR